MFEEISGLPLHPLVVHAAVVFVPLLALVALAYALVPRWREKVGWAAVGLAVLAPLATVVAVLSGDAFQQRRALPLEGTTLADHRTFGQVTMWVTIGLGLLTLGLVLLRRTVSRPPAWAVASLTALLVLAAVAAVVSGVLVGDSGARHLWEPIWSVVP